MWTEPKGVMNRARTTQTSVPRIPLQSRPHDRLRLSNDSRRSILGRGSVASRTSILHTQRVGHRGARGNRVWVQHLRPHATGRDSVWRTDAQATRPHSCGRIDGLDCPSGVFQTFLVATRRTLLHRRLGVVGGALASGVIVFGWLVAARATDPTVNPQAFEFFILPSSELLVFTVLIACALLWRQTPSTHKRLMLLGTLALIPAATTRPAPPGSLLFLIGMVGVPEAVFILALVAHDLRTSRRVHPATIWGGGLVLVVAATRVWISTTGPWLAFAEAVTQ